MKDSDRSKSKNPGGHPDRRTSEGIEYKGKTILKWVCGLCARMREASPGGEAARLLARMMKTGGTDAAVLRDWRAHVHKKRRNSKSDKKPLPPASYF